MSAVQDDDRTRGVREAMIAAAGSLWRGAAVAPLIAGALLFLGPGAVALAISPPTIAEAFGASAVQLDGTTTMTFTITNPNVDSGLTGVGFTDSLPAGLVVATPDGLTGSCGGGTITAVANSQSVSLNGASLNSEIGLSCSFTVSVIGVTAGLHINVTSAITSDQASGSEAAAGIYVTAPPSISTSFLANTIPLHGTTTLTFTINNPNPSLGAPPRRRSARTRIAGPLPPSGTLTGVGFADTLPSDLVVATPNGLTGSCGGGTITATAGSGSISLSGATLTPAQSCTFSVDVTGVAAGFDDNVVGVTSTEGGDGNVASSHIRILAPPTIAKAFGASSIALGASTPLTFTLTNPNSECVRCSPPASTLTGVGFTDTLPSGLVVATPNGLTGRCGGGTITAVAGSGSVSLSGATLGSRCSFSVNVTGTVAGVQDNTTDAVTSDNGGTGGTGSASVGVVGAPSLASSANPATEGATSVTYTATVSPVPDSGTIGFFDGDAIITGCSAVAIDESGTALCSAGVYPTASTHDITATLTLGDGSVTSAPLSEAVGDAALTATAGADLSGSESVAVPSTVLATFTDANPNGAAGDFTAAVDWGDGSTGAGVVGSVEGGFEVTGGHTYADSGAHRVDVTITDTKGGATATASLTAEIADVPLVASGTPTIQAAAGQQISQVVATFADPSGKEPVADYGATISWGDGTSSVGAIADPPGIYTVSGSHTYGAAGTYRVTITVAERDPGASSAVAATSPVVVAAVSTPATLAAVRSQPLVPLGTAVVLALGVLAQVRRSRPR